MSAISNLLLRAHEHVREKIRPLSVEHRYPKFTLFASMSDGDSRAVVRHASADDFDTAWRTLASRCQSYVVRSELDVCWFRLDWVSDIDEVGWDEFGRRLSVTKRNYFRLGIALDDQLSIAMTELELNGNACLYRSEVSPSAVLNTKNLSLYLQRRFELDAEVDLSVVKSLHLFSTSGIFLMSDDARDRVPGINSVIELNDGVRVSDNWRDSAHLNCGRRRIEDLTPECIRALVCSATDYLSKQIQSDGRFVYGHFPCFARNIAFYNALRHASSLYALLEGYEVVREDEILDRARLGLHYLATTLIRTWDDEREGRFSYLVDEGGEIKLGGNAVCLLAFVKYTEVTGDRQYLPLLESLAAGILRMQDPDSGRFKHVLNASDLSVRQDFRIVYYDGEAAFGLMRLYGLTHDARWLGAVERAFDYFIASEHWRFHDHWLSYCVNEITRYRPDPKYFMFGVQNIDGILDFILTRETTYPTLLELSMAFEKMLGRIKELPEMLGVIRDFDEDKFVRAMTYRAKYLLNGFFWPEVAMYFKRPASIVGSFFIRHHGFRVRIDDVEHYISGYVAYLNYLRKVGQ